HYLKLLTKLKPKLDAHGVRTVAIGYEEIGLDNFQEGNFFGGELFIDYGKTAHSTLGFTRLNMFTGIYTMLKSKMWQATNEAKKDGVEGLTIGDRFQNGGMLAVSAGGKDVLLKYIQSGPEEHMSFEDVFKALGIEDSVPDEAMAPAPQCDTDVCKLK
ncbi:prostamide/prostaglandin F synthase-like, partial [Lingula anatina]|uniref:Prostamide/prostaglandin F synthase-like n=1 Tax=Lingula anatina TaxID=7574 RepID=A0A1S3JT83_LINAN